MTTQTQTIAAGYEVAPQQVIDLIGKDAKITHEFCYAHPVADKYSNTIHFGALVYPKRYAIDAELKQHAANEYAKMKQDLISSIGNKLVFVGMGMSYTERYEDDVCNHRIRTEIVNPEGRKFFIEVCAGKGENMHITHVTDRDQEHDYSIKAAEYRKKIEEAGGFWKIGKGHHLYEQYQNYMSQPYYWYKKQEWNSLNAKYTNANVLKLVNKLFDCNFTEMVVCDYLLSTEDYASTSTK